jgi:hypothetical protein
MEGDHRNQQAAVDLGGLETFRKSLPNALAIGLPARDD